MSPTPHIGSFVTLSPEGFAGEIHSSVVLFTTDEYIAVEVPKDWPAGDLTEPLPLEISWAGEKGVHVLPVVATERAGRGSNLLWELNPDGDYRFEQRRTFVRVSVRSAMTIANLESETAASERATLVDVSEASLQCATQDTGWLDAPAKTAVHVRFTVAETEFSSGGVLLRATRIGSEHNPRGSRVVILFDERAEFHERLRRAVFSEQRRQIIEERNRVDFS